VKDAPLPLAPQPEIAAVPPFVRRWSFISPRRD